MAGVKGLHILALILLACIAEAPALAVASDVDGRPRPDGYPDIPTKDYGPTPPCYLDNKVVTCDWYGFAHILYPVEGLSCLTYTRAILANTTLNPPGSLDPYSYYYMTSMVFNKTNNDSYCLYGCFDMSTSASPPLGSAPPPATVGTPPPVDSPPTSSPPPATMAPPPPLVAPPPPSTLLAPPPPSTFLIPPPNSLAPPALPPPNTPAVPPPPGGGTVINLNGAGFLQPKGLVSFILSGALLILNGLVGF